MSGVLQHRPTSRYVRCRCQDCLRKRRRQVKLRALGKGGMVPVDAVAEFLDRLKARGLSNYDIAAAAGLDSSKVSRYRLRRVASVRWSVANRILTADYSEQLPGTRVPAVGTGRRLRALAAMGWPIRYVADRIGAPPSTLGTVASGDAVHTSSWLAKAVSSVYDDLAGTVGPSDLARERARRKGWAPPLAWDDIDDPDEAPSL